MTKQSQVWANVATEYRRIAALPISSHQRGAACKEALLLAADQADKMVARWQAQGN